MTTDDLSNIYVEAEKYLWTSVKRYSLYSYHDLQEAVHEGMIRVWRDLEDGYTEKLHILRRAAMRSREILYTHNEQTLGKPRLSHEGTSYSPIREKIQVYLAEYMPVHDNVWPKAKDVAAALGISKDSAAEQLRNIKTGKFNHGVMKQRKDGSFIKDADYYRPISVEGLNSNISSVEGSRQWTDSPLVSQYSETWENGLIDSLDMAEYISELQPRYQQAIHLYFYLGYTYHEIGTYLKFDKNPSQNGSQVVRRAIAQLQTIVAPYEGECAKGHKRTPENTHIYKRDAGTIIRQCIPCNNIHKANDKRRTGNVKKVIKSSKPKSCEEHGPMTLVDSRGGLRCHECRKATQRKYAAKKRNDSTE